MNEYRKVKENHDLVRDMHSKAVINTNRTAYQAAIHRKKNVYCTKR